MGGPTQLFKYTELKSRTAKQGETLKKKAVAAIAAETAKDIARVIIVVRNPNVPGARKKGRGRRKHK
jgi:hypothetical protein